MIDRSQMIVPGSIMLLMPVLTSSPMITPSFLRPVSMSSPLNETLTGWSSKRRFATLVPAPKLHRSPIDAVPDVVVMGDVRSGHDDGVLDLHRRSDPHVLPQAGAPAGCSSSGRCRSPWRCRPAPRCRLPLRTTRPLLHHHLALQDRPLLHVSLDVALRCRDIRISLALSRSQGLPDVHPFPQPVDCRCRSCAASMFSVSVISYSPRGDFFGLSDVLEYLWGEDEQARVDQVARSGPSASR